MNVLMLSNKIEWSYLSQFEESGVEFNINITGDLTDDLEKNDDYDFIVCHSTDQFKEEKLMKLKELALNVSNNNNKRVSVGYYYLNTGVNYGSVEEIKILSFKNGDVYEMTVPSMPDFSAGELAQLVESNHKALDNQKVNQRSN